MDWREAMWQQGYELGCCWNSLGYSDGSGDKKKMEYLRDVSDMESKTLGDRLGSRIKERQKG